MIDPAPLSPSRSRMIVCGDNPLAYRLAAELAGQGRCDVTVMVQSAVANCAPRIAELADIRLVETREFSVAAYEAAGIAEADAVALVDQDDVGNIHAALCAQDANPNARLVIRFFNMNLGYRIQELFPGSAVLSDSATAAPSFVAAALGEVTPGSARLPGRPRRTVFVARRADVAPSRVVCGLADTTAPDGPILLPTDEETADLVLAIADERGVGLQPRRLRQLCSVLKSVARLIRLVINRKFVAAALMLFVLLGLGTVAFAVLTGVTWSDAIYLTVLDAAGAAQPDTKLNTTTKIIRFVITVVGSTIIPVVTAAVVDAVVSARLASPPALPRRISGHIVLVGLGNVGARILSQLHDLGVSLIAVEHDPAARGIPRARRLGVPVVIGDASREDVLREAHLDTSRALVAVTNNDVTNLEAGLHGRAMRSNLRVVLRLFDDDLARRVEQTFKINVSRSVSYLAAPMFAAAMFQRQVLTTIPVGRHVLLIAEVPIPAHCALVGQPVRDVSVPGESRVVALHIHSSERLELPPSLEHRLVGGDRLIVVATRRGLVELLLRASRPPSATLFLATEPPARLIKLDE
ncbi:MAG: NAD-binding protein [Pseudonocardia sp.]|nr:NAD-binding protein [Pseudonocardia sp.]